MVGPCFLLQEHSPEPSPLLGIFEKKTKKKKRTAITQPTEGGFPCGSLIMQVLFTCQPAALENQKASERWYIGLWESCLWTNSWCPFHSPSLFLFLYPFEGAEHRSLVPSSDSIRLLISPAFISPLPLKHCDNAEVDKATCTASSASTSLQAESIQDNGNWSALFREVFLIYIFSRFLEWLILCVGKMLWIWLQFENQLSISVEENVVCVCAYMCV